MLVLIEYFFLLATYCYYPLDSTKLLFLYEQFDLGLHCLLRLTVQIADLR